ncbi:hypothetical protein R4Z10_12355 [Niallia sp. XMNu-256]|uniref:hypothetical protein n=1 Tax=Niallia sp. XMNu-256 TaxID=3082444 RepID=UPI0030CBBC46
MSFEVMGFEIKITGKLIVKTVLFLIIAVALSFLAFSGGRSTLTTTAEVCTENAIAAGVEPVGCDGP